MPASRLGAVFLGGLVLTSFAMAGSAMVTPGRTLVQEGDVTPLALTARRVAMGVGVSPAECRVRTWPVGTRSVTTFGQPRAPTCTIETSTGAGIATVAVATGRVVWLAYAGGNIREWSLFTARTPGARPLRLRFATRSVDAPPPIVVGPGTPQGVPYAVNREIVYLGEDGARLFRTVATDAVRLVAAGPGPSGIRVVALTAAGHILALGGDGNPVADDIVVDEPVKALRLFAAGVAYQAGSLVHVVGPTDQTLVTLPRGATMVDAAVGRILYQRAGDLGALTIATGSDTLLVDGSPAKPVLGQLEAAGLAWARGATVNWRVGPLPR